MTIDNMKERLREILKERSYKKGDILLASGKRSDFYIDCRETSLNPEGAYLLGKVLFQTLISLNKDIEAVAGPTMGADPLVTAVTVISFQEKSPMPALIVRKEPKSHGMSLWIEGRGSLRDGARVALLEDVVTTGGSVLKAIKWVEEEGFKVVHVIAVLDRGDGGGERIQKEGYDFNALFTLKDVADKQK
ncbi:MAG: orotate phosphoribosyltransferase [Thermodesulfobacteriota bacterium]